MKTKKYIPLSAFALVCFFALSFASCSRCEPDIPRGSEGSGNLVAMLRGSQGNALDGTGDNVIYSIRMLVFCNDDGTLIDQKLFTRPSAGWDDIDIEMEDMPTGGPLDIRMIANEASGTTLAFDMTAALDAVSDLDDLYAIRTGIRTAPIVYGDIEDMGLLMTGGVDNETIAAGGSTVPISLTHLTARIDVVVVDGVTGVMPSGYGVNLSAAILHRASGFSYLFCNADILFGERAEFSQGWDVFFGDPPLPDRPNNSDRWIFPSMYLYENLLGNATLERTYLLLSFNGTGATADPFFQISVDINGHLPIGRYLIQRGQHTTITVNVWYPVEDKDSFTRTATTPSWTVEISQKPMN